jgi:ABC-type transport system substrate-binding protein
MLGEYKRSSKITLIANPHYREVTYTPAGPIPAESQRITDALKGKRLPVPGRIEINVIEEGQAAWLAFLNGELDMLERLPSDFIEQAIVGGKLKPELAAKGIQHEILLRPNTWWTYFNMDDPVVGGYTPEKIALRRAIGMAYDQAEGIRILLKGRAVPAYGPVPPTSPVTTRSRRRMRSCSILHLHARSSTVLDTRTAMATAFAKRRTASRS